MPHGYGIGYVLPFVYLTLWSYGALEINFTLILNTLDTQCVGQLDGVVNNKTSGRVETETKIS
jgi:hypothetical protein